jgi:DNA-directed RNA polymerase specialized sigma24 family protein
MSDYPSVDDLIDEVLARAAGDSDLLKHPENAAAKLFSIVLDVAKEGVADERRRRRMLSLEAPPPRHATDTPTAFDDTFYDFFQPDNLTKVEDLAADRSGDPEEAVGRKEMQRLIASLFASMPAAWRRAVVLTRVGGLPIAAVAQALSITEAEVRDSLARADNFLRARLHDEDIVSSESSQLSYLAEASSIDGSEMEASFDEALENESAQ